MARGFLPIFPWKTLTGTVFVTALALAGFGLLTHSLPDSAQQLHDEQKDFVLARGKILQLDEILTMSARMGAATGDSFWVTRYNQHELELGDLIESVSSIASDHQVKAAIAITNNANDQLVDMEKRAFAAIERGDLAGAQRLLYSEQYEAQKLIYTQGMHDFLTKIEALFEKEVDGQKERYFMAKMLGFLVCILVLIIWAVVISILRRWNELNEDNQRDLLDAKTFVSLAARGAGLAPWRYSNLTDGVELSALCASMLGLEVEGSYPIRTVLKTFRSEDRRSILASIRRSIAETNNPAFQLECPVDIAGKFRWVTCSGLVELNNNKGTGRPTLNIRGALHDITRRKQAEDIVHATNDALEEGALNRLGLVERQAGELRRLALELTQVEQKERQRLSMVLHDHLQQLLVSARFQLAMLVNPVPRDIDDKVRILDEVLDECISESRSLSTELSPPILKDAGFLAACDWLVLQTRSAHGLEINLRVNPDAEPYNDTLRTLLFQALRELLLNVIKHAGVRSVEVDIDLDAEDRIVVMVRDQGYGFDAVGYNNRALKQSDSCLGLFSLRERIIALGGNCDIESERGKGTSVRLSLDRGLSSAGRSIASIITMARATPLIPAEIVTRAQVRVLVVDNHLELRRGLCALLHSEGGYLVVGEASDGYEAIELHQRLRPDLVIMDLAMPGLSGIEATKSITSLDGSVPIVGLSVHETEDMKEAMLAAGASAYFSKAEPTEVLLETLKRLTHEQGVGPVVRPKALEVASSLD